MARKAGLKALIGLVAKERNLPYKRAHNWVAELLQMLWEDTSYLAEEHSERNATAERNSAVAKRLAQLYPELFPEAPRSANIHNWLLDMGINRAKHELPLISPDVSIPPRKHYRVILRACTKDPAPQKKK